MSGRLAWRAIAIGVAVSISASLVVAVLGGMLGPLVDALGVAVVSWSIRLFGLGADATAGFVAGRLAGRDGALHGLVAGAIGAAAGLAISLPPALRAGFSPDAGWWLQVVPGAWPAWCWPSSAARWAPSPAAAAPDGAVCGRGPRAAAGFIRSRC